MPSVRRARVIVPFLNPAERLLYLLAYPNIETHHSVLSDLYLAHYLFIHHISFCPRQPGPVNSRSFLFLFLVLISFLRHTFRSFFCLFFLAGLLIFEMLLACPNVYLA